MPCGPKVQEARQRPSAESGDTCGAPEWPRARAIRRLSSLVLGDSGGHLTGAISPVPRFPRLLLKKSDTNVAFRNLAKVKPCKVLLSVTYGLARSQECKCRLSPETEVTKKNERTPLKAQAAKLTARAPPFPSPPGRSGTSRDPGPPCSRWYLPLCAPSPIPASMVQRVCLRMEPPVYI